MMQKRRGLVVVAGGVRSGKSTTVAAMIDQINELDAKHVLTVEDPIEFIHPPKKCNISQRQVGTDTESFLSGVCAAVRQGADVLFIGDLAEVSVLDAALDAAELGMLVIGVARAPTVARTVARLTALLPGDGLRRLSDVLVGVVAQRLVLKRDASAYVLAAEVLVVTDDVRHILCAKVGIADLERSLEAAMNAGAEPFGMQTFETATLRLAGHPTSTFPPRPAIP